jgi:hypothetical protein
MKHSTRLITVTAFSVAMAFMESAVVIYLRKLYYPGGFGFPLVPIGTDIGVVEVIREAATLIMLVTAGLIAGKTRVEKFAFFIYCFAIWDIFYYVFLKLFLDWPESLLTWDLLFLIPVPWVGPVIAPCIVSLTMIVLALVIIYHQSKSEINPGFIGWTIFISGSIVLIFSFIWDYLVFSDVVKNSRRGSVSMKQGLLDDFTSYIPDSFNWWLFLSGELIIIAGIILLLKSPHLLFKKKN